MPDDMPYHCVSCKHSDRPNWSSILQQEMMLGFNTVLEALNDDQRSFDLAPADNSEVCSSCSKKLKNGYLHI